MSRVGKQPITIPKGIEASIEGGVVTVKGKNGQLQHELPSGVIVNIDGSTVNVSVDDVSTQSALWGLTRSLVANMIEGVDKGFQKQLEIHGVGYKAVLQGKKLVFNLGFSHSIEVESPEGIEFSVEKNVVTISGIDKQKVGQIAAEIRSLRKPEPYKGKGIRYVGEQVRRKAGKKAATTEGAAGGGK